MMNRFQTLLSNFNLRHYTTVNATQETGSNATGNIYYFQLKSAVGQCRLTISKTRVGSVYGFSARYYYTMNRFQDVLSNSICTNTLRSPAPTWSLC